MVLDPEHPWEPEYDDRGTWEVQTGGLGKGKGNDYGVVSDGRGFEDSPDCERIAGGINSKGPHAVAIGRQANMLQWGFYAAPDRMTPSARTAFLNALVYMRQFDGHVPLVQKQGRSRSWYESYLTRLEKTSAADRDSGIVRYYLEQFPADLVERVGLDAPALRAWYEANVEYLHGPERYKFAVDADLARLRLSNRKPAFLDWLIERLEADAEDALALRLADRYLEPDVGRDAAAIVGWVRANRTALFFSDTGGFRWFVDRNAAPTVGG